MKLKTKKTLHSSKDMKMRNFWCLFFVVSLPADSFQEEKKADKITGTLGESVTFRLKMSEQFTSLSWLRQTSKTFSHIATVNSGPPCHVTVVLPKLEGRLNVSRDCRGIIISNLRQDDSGVYKGQIGENEEFFRLEVYKKLSESDLEVQCDKNKTLGDGNYTSKLNCSAGKWGDGVSYTWSSASKDREIVSPVLQIHFQDDDDANYTCTAENPISKASKTVSVKQTCEAHPTKGPGTVTTTETGDQSDEQSLITTLIVGIILVTVVTAVAGAGYVAWKKQKRAAHSMPPDPTGCSVPGESCKTIYAQIEPPETQQRGMKKKPQKRPKAQEGLHTIYSSVVHPKPTTLQTDDEKIQMEGRGTSENSEKTIYSTVTKPQETDDSSIKTVYDTVNAPRCPEGSEFHKLL